MDEPPITVMTKAYALASSLRSELRQRASIEAARASSSSAAKLRDIGDLAHKDRMLIIGMTITECVRLLEEGVWLNIYEIVASESGLSGDALEDAVDERLKRKGINWSLRRHKIEKLLHFGTDVHYASLAFGGDPEGRYGDGACSVVFDLQHWEPRATCFAGDPLRVCFNEAGDQILTDDQVLNLFAVGEDWWDLLLLQSSTLVRTLADEQKPWIDPREVRSLLEDPDFMLEFHLHGPVTRSQVRKVIIPRRFTVRWQRQMDLWEVQRQQPAQERHALVNAPRFQKLLTLVKHFDISLQVGEEK